MQTSSPLFSTITRAAIRARSKDDGNFFPLCVLVTLCLSLINTLCKNITNFNPTLTNARKTSIIFSEARPSDRAKIPRVDSKEESFGVPGNTCVKRPITLLYNVKLPFSRVRKAFLEFKSADSRNKKSPDLRASMPIDSNLTESEVDGTRTRNHRIDSPGL